MQKITIGNFGGVMKFLLAIGVIAGLVYGGDMLKAQVEVVGAEAVINRAEHERLLVLEANKHILEEDLRVANFKVRELERKFPSNLSHEHIILDLYRAKYAVPALNRDDVRMDINGDIVSRTVVGDASTGGTIMTRVQSISIIYSFDYDANTYATLKTFILELERTPRRYRVTAIDLRYSPSGATNVNLSVEAYGVAPSTEERELTKDMALSWYSPTRKGKVSIFAVTPTEDNLIFNETLFGMAYPPSFYRDFVLNINSHNPYMPSVAFRRHNDISTTVSGEQRLITLDILQGGEGEDKPDEDEHKYFYSFEMGDQRFPRNGLQEILLFNDRDIIIGIIDDTDPEILASLEQIVLTVNNQTDKTVRFVGEIRKRLRVEGTGFVL
jgi:hypothetical protein